MIVPALYARSAAAGKHAGLSAGRHLVCCGDPVYTAGRTGCSAQGRADIGYQLSFNVSIVFDGEVGQDLDQRPASFRMKPEFLGVLLTASCGLIEVCRTLGRPGWHTSG